MPAPCRPGGTSRAGRTMLAPSDSQDGSGDPTVLFDEYVQGVLDGHPPDVETLCRRAGDRSGDLQAMIGVARLLQDIRPGAADVALPSDGPPGASIPARRRRSRPRAPPPSAWRAWPRAASWSRAWPRRWTTATAAA